MNGEVAAFTLAADGGGNVGVCVGVLGDESCAESREEPESETGVDLLGSCDAFFGATEVAFESTADPTSALCSC